MQPGGVRLLTPPLSQDLSHRIPGWKMLHETAHMSVELSRNVRETVRRVLPTRDPLDLYNLLTHILLNPELLQLKVFDAPYPRSVHDASSRS